MSLFEDSIRRLLSARTSLKPAEADSSFQTSRYIKSLPSLEMGEARIRDAAGFPEDNAAALSDALERENRRYTRTLTIEGVIG